MANAKGGTSACVDDLRAFAAGLDQLDERRQLILGGMAMALSRRLFTHDEIAHLLLEPGGDADSLERALDQRGALVIWRAELAKALSGTGAP